MPKEKRSPAFQVGDRIRVYDNWAITGIIDAICQDGRIRIDNRSAWFHPKQCRRLKKKKRRRVWKARNPRTGLWQVFDYNPQNADEPSPEVIEFIEVRKKK